MTNIVFAAISPHPPLLLPTVGSKEDRQRVKDTIQSLERLSKNFKKSGAEEIIISSPHPDWGFNVPLFFIAKDFKGKTKEILTDLKDPKTYFEEGKEAFKALDKNKKYGIIASGDLSHCLKEDGPYGFHRDGPNFDKELIESLKRKNTERILKLDELFPEAGECGLRSFCFLLGTLEESKKSWQTDILSYEGPFGVGYLVTNFKL